MVGIALKHFSKKNMSDNQGFLSYYLSTGKSLSLFSSFIIKENIQEDKKSEFRTLNAKISSLNSGIEAANLTRNQTKLDSLSEELYKVNLKLKDIYKNLNDVNLTSEFRSNRFISLENLEKNFSSGEFVIDFFEYDNEYYAYTFFNGNIKFHTLDLEFLTKESLISSYKNLSQFNELNELTDLLSDEMGKLFPEKTDDIQSIIIIPDGKLLEIPFETIKNNGKELVHQYPIIYLNSINDYYERSAKRINARKLYAGFGLTYNKTLLKNINESEEIQSLFNNKFRLASLPNAVKELNTTNANFKGKLFLEEKSTVDAFVNHSKNAKIIHITNHVLLNNSNSHLSSIVFAENDNPLLLNTLDIKALELNAQLAILSSCNSGAGQSFSGNGIRSIGQSFFEAGCQSVIANLWEAGDKSSMKIISSFMEYIKEGESKDIALQKAKIDFLNQASDAEKHPKYWANIILIGDKTPISNSSFGTKKYFYIGAGGLLIAILVYMRKKKRAA